MAAKPYVMKIGKQVNNTALLHLAPTADDEGVLVGVVDSPQLAQIICASVNATGGVPVVLAKKR